MDDCIDYRLVCRTCLASEAEFYKLDARTYIDDDDEKVSFRECLKYCTKLEDVAEFPIYICTECSTALQVAYNFMKNALEAHEILRKKLIPSQPTRVNGQLASSSSSSTVAVTSERKVSFRCKICNERVETKRSLKEHVKLHLDIITYPCEICQYQTKTRGNLNEHYIVTHGLLATKDQLKPKTNQSQSLQVQVNPQLHQVQTNPQLHQVQTNPQQQLLVNPPHQQESVQIVTNQFHPYQPQQIVQQPPMNVAQFLASSQSDLQPIPLQLATVIGSAPSISNAQIELGSNMHNFGNELSIGNEINIGNEFVVMQDGTVQEVMSNGVVINYIDTGEGSVALDNGIFINNLMVQPSDGDANINDGVNVVNGTMETDFVNVTETDALNVNTESEPVNMDIDDIIVEDNVQNIVADVPASSNAPIAPEPAVQSEQPKTIRCKMCKSAFALQEELKEHMLTHNEIPHFFCEVCNFYTFFKIDLTQHYKTKHHTQPNNRQLQPKNKVNFNVPDFARKVFICEMCIYDTPVKAIMRRHYLSKHQIEATELQLRPIKLTPNVSTSETDDSAQKPKISMTVENLPKTPQREFPNGLNCTKCNMVFYSDVRLKEHCKQHNLDEMAKRIQANLSATINEPTSKNTPATTSVAFDKDADVDVGKLIASTELPSNLISPQVDGVPPDAIPQIVETDSIVDNILDFDFNGDAIFEDDSEENDDTEFADYVLTTDDEQEYANESRTSDASVKTNSFCIQCNKKFSTHYEFENHMFVHRGLAPYRCGMCTNLYNTKRDLMRHYQAVHKVIPTRDMIQAKGDKVIDPAENSELDQMLNSGKVNDAGFLCAKCPFDTTHIDDIKVHLSVMHGVDDENYILKKLPHECPKCIRTFDSNLRLIRHIERNHSSNLICHITKDNNDNVSCKRCGLALLMSEQKAHEALCNRITTYECLICDLVFNTRSKFLIHKKKYHSKDTMQKSSQQLTCKLCHKTYRSVFALRYHLKRHNARKHSCVQCPKTFVTTTEYKHHMLTHTGEFPNVCSLCNKAFRYTYHLRRHKYRVHTERRYTCEALDCTERFISASELKMHAASHVIEDFSCSYKCQYCSEEFYIKELLRFHAKSIHQKILADDLNVESDQNDFCASIVKSTELNESRWESGIE